MPASGSVPASCSGSPPIGWISYAGPFGWTSRWSGSAGRGYSSPRSSSLRPPTGHSPSLMSSARRSPLTCKPSPRTPSWVLWGSRGSVTKKPSNHKGFSLDVVVEHELPRVGTQPHRVDLVLSLVGDPGVDEIAGKDAASP